METSVLHGVLNADGLTVKAGDIGSLLGVTARGFMAVILRGLPKDIETVMSVKTYVKDSKGEIRAMSDAVTITYPVNDPTLKMVNAMKGLNVLAIGDSLFHGSTIGYSKQWIGLLAQQCSWNFTNLGRNGATVSYNSSINGSTGGSRNSIYYNLFNKSDFEYGTTNSSYYNYGDTSGGKESVDLIFLQGGVNDWNQLVKLGDVNSTDPGTLYGSRRLIIDKLLTDYPNAKIVLVTTWYVDGSRENGTRMDFVSNNIKNLYNAHYKNNDRVFVLDAGNPAVSGANMNDSAWRTLYCPNDYSHLNAAGMIFMQKAMLPYVYEIMEGK